MSLFFLMLIKVSSMIKKTFFVGMIRCKYQICYKICLKWQNNQIKGAIVALQNFETILIILVTCFDAPKSMIILISSQILDLHLLTHLPTF